MNLYDVLGVDKDASQADIKRAYKRASQRHHPDKGGDPWDEVALAYVYGLRPSSINQPEKINMSQNETIATDSLTHPENMAQAMQRLRDAVDCLQHLRNEIYGEAKANDEDAGKISKIRAVPPVSEIMMSGPTQIFDLAGDIEKQVIQIRSALI